MQEFTGIITGLICALFQASSYICTRWFIHKCGRTPLDLLIISHIMMGALCICLLPISWPSGLSNSSQLIFPLVTNAISYLSGQFCFFMALKHAEASRVSPVMGIKIFVVSLFSFIFLKTSFNFMQIFSIALCILSLVMLNWSGKSIPIKAVIWILLACCGYAGSDTSGQYFMKELPELSSFHKSSFFVIASYSLSAIIGLCFYPTLKRVNTKTWQYAIPFSFFWLSSMFLLFFTFTHIGLVYGVIIQSSRGLMSIIIGLIIAKMGHDHLESKVSKRIFIQRIAAATLMILAIFLYKANSPKTNKPRSLSRNQHIKHIILQFHICQPSLHLEYRQHL